MVWPEEWSFYRVVNDSEESHHLNVCEGGKACGLTDIGKERSRPVTCFFDDVKEMIVTENNYKDIPNNVLKTYFLPKGWS